MSDRPYQDTARPHEETDASVKVINVTVWSVVGGIVASLIVSGFLWRPWPSARRLEPDQRFQYGPADVPDILREWPAIERETQEHLHTYGWVDRQHGVVRIPIEQAMKRMASP